MEIVISDVFLVTKDGQIKGLMLETSAFLLFTVANLCFQLSC